jgi:hypothetical protein
MSKRQCSTHGVCTAPHITKKDDLARELRAYFPNKKAHTKNTATLLANQINQPKTKPHKFNCKTTKNVNAE